MKYKDIINGLDNYSKYGNGFTKEDAINTIKLIEELKNEKIKLIEKYKDKLIDEIRVSEDCTFQCYGCLCECKYSIPYIIDIATEMIENIEKRHIDSSNWVSVKDRLPKDDNFVLVYNSKDKEIIIANYRGNNAWDSYVYGWLPDDTVTYWQPLPELPEVEE